MEARPTLSRGTAIAWAVVALLTAYLVFIGGSAAGLLYASVRVVSVGLVAVLLVAWVIAIRRDPAHRPRSAIWPALAASLAAFIVSTILSWNQRVSVEYLAFATLLVALYLVLVRILAVPSLRVRMIGLAGGLAIGISLLYVGAVVRHWLDWWAAVGRFAAPPLRPAFEGLMFTDPGGTAAITSLLASPAVAWLALRGRRGRVAAFLIVALVGVVVLLTGARGAWLAVGVAIVMTAVAAFVSPGARDAARTTLKAIPRWAMVAAGAIVVVGAVVVAPIVINRLESGGGDNLRVTLAATGLRMFQEAPIAGMGPGNWVIRRAAFTEAGEVDYYIPHAHNVYAQIAGEFGIVGILATLVVVFFVGRLVLRALRGSSLERRAFALAAVFSITYLAVHQVVDMYMNIPAIMFAGVLPIALLDATAAPEEVPEISRFEGAVHRVVTPAVALACVAAIVVIVLVQLRAIPGSQIGEHANADDWAGAAVIAEQVLADDPAFPAYRFMRGLTAARGSDLETAERELRASADEDDFVFAWLNVAALALERGDEAEARDALGRALRLGVQQPAITLPAGELYLLLGDEQAAIDAFATTLTTVPMVTDDPYWTESGPEIAAAYETAVDQAIAASSPATAAVISLLHGDADEALAAAAQLEEPERTATELAIRAWGGDADARRQLEVLAEANPSEKSAVIWLSRLAARDGNGAERFRYRTWIAMSEISGGDIGDDTVVTDEPVVGGQVAGANGNLQGWYVYLRQYPWDLLVPGLPKLSLR